MPLELFVQSIRECWSNIAGRWRFPSISMHGHLTSVAFLASPWCGSRSLGKMASVCFLPWMRLYLLALAVGVAASLDSTLWAVLWQSPLFGTSSHDQLLFLAASRMDSSKVHRGSIAAVMRFTAEERRPSHKPYLRAG